MFSSIVAVALAFAPVSFATSAHFRLAAAPGYQNRDVCPARCSSSGPIPGNWSLYHNFDQIASCSETVFYDFTLLDPVDDANSLHRIYACTNYGPDWENLATNTTGTAPLPSSTTNNNATYQIGYWPTASGAPVAAEARTISSQLRQYLANGYAAVNRPVMLFASAGTGSVGLYIGKALQNQNIGSFALETLESYILTADVNNTATLAMQYCEPHSNADHIFGFIATGNSSFGAVQTALTSWSKAGCLSIPEVSNVTGPVTFAGSLVVPSNTTINSTSIKSTTSASHSSLSAETSSTSAGTHVRTSLSSSPKASSSTSRSSQSPQAASISRRGDCSTVQVASGDSCGSLAQKCGITGAQFTQYNPGSDFCADLKPYQHVCCSSGTLPNFAPKPQSDGTCATYTIVANDNCPDLAAEYSLTVDEIESYNKDTWSWNGCDKIFIGTIMCLSSGSPPMPAALSNAVCGPQVPGTQQPPSGTNISSLNPCPLNACCDVWGQCGTTSDFCTDTGTGAPGTAAPGTNGCISNCGTNIVRGSPPAAYRSVAFFEGFNLGRPCLYQTASQIDVSKYTHIFFAFGTLDAGYNVQVGDTLSTYEFGNFLQISGPAKILSIGGWAFSTDPSTYNIFRTGVTAGNRQTMANNIASFVQKNNLDGVNMDWEYPGAPDIPGIPPGNADDGDNYLAFLTELRSLLPNKEISVAAPASYWYLRGFPIAKMSDVLDYVIYMTYDLHGQWDANNQWSQIGCPSGTCLRSDVNLTETIGSLVMITKAGVPSGKVVVGVTSYGRSFAMSDAGCYGPQCTYLGSAGNSQAAPGPCTGTAGYISNAEIQQIITNGSRVNQNFVDPTSNSNILVYDDTQWVGYMDDSIKASRSNIYKGLAMGGVTDWATDLQQYNDPPARASSWASFLSKAQVGGDPADVGTRSGNWTKLTCTDPSVTDIRDLSPQQRWDDMDCPDAWTDVINVWETYDNGKDGLSFTASISDTIHGPEDADCGKIGPGSNCEQTLQCYTGDGTGPAAYELWNSMVIVNEMYTSFSDALTGAAATLIDNSLASFETTFAPVPPPPSDEWIEILIGLVTLGASMVAAPFFNIVFKTMPFFKNTQNELGVLKDTTSALITFGSNVAKAAITPTEQSQWTATDQNNFNAYLGQVLYGWGNATEFALAGLFDGSTAGISALTSAIQNGQLIEGNTGVPTNPNPATPDTLSALETSIATAFYGFAIPAVWYAAGTAAFVMDSGYKCGTVDPLGSYMSTDTMHATAGCYNGELYYLVYPKGSASTCSSSKRCVDCGPPPCKTNQFQPPPGLSDLDGSAWGGITVQTLIQGAVRTFAQNGNQNGGAIADPGNAGTVGDLINQDVTTPGYIRLPVCSPATAFNAWANPSRVNTADPNYPCVPLQGITDCHSYTYENQGSDASPSIADCQAIISNIQGTTGEWTTGIGGQRDIASAGSCNFGVQNSGVTGDVTYKTGAQDIVNIIGQSIKNYGTNGKVGAKGTMVCSGDAGNQNVNWGLY